MTTAPITLADLGWRDELMPDELRTSADVMSGRLRPARVSSVYAARVEVWPPSGPRLASLRSRLLRRANEGGLEGGIAVGDWALVAPVSSRASSSDEVVVEEILPRRTVFLRQAAGERSEPQSIAANLDRVFVVTDIDRDFNVRRLERYLLAISAGGAEAQIVLTKTDLAESELDLATKLAQASALAPTFQTSAKSGVGIDELRARIPEGLTAALVGSSGVGKSALVNCLLGQDAQLEGAVREHDRRGRHTTTRRSLFLLPPTANHARGGLLIDTPGMRELKPWIPEGETDELDVAWGETFADIAQLADRCRYRDCTHTREPGCALQEAIASGEVPQGRFESFKKLLEEREARGQRQAGFAALQARRQKARTISIAARKRIWEKGR